MIRTQIYLTKRQRDELAAIAKAAGKKQSEVIREALDGFIDRRGQSHRDTILRDVAGMWKERDDLPDFGALRRDWDRSR